MNEKRINKVITISIILGIILLILGVTLMFTLNIIYFIIISFIGVLFLILIPTRIIKKNSYDLKEYLDDLIRTPYQELIYNLLIDKTLLNTLDVFISTLDLGLTNSYIELTSNKDVIKLYLNPKKIKINKNKQKQILNLINYKEYNDLLNDLNLLINKIK